MENSKKTMEKVVNLCKSRGFVFPGSEIYGGFANTWDYGPVGVELENNIKKVCEMAEYFVNETDPTVGKLYINYPMMESFKDCDSFQDLGYLTHAIKLDDIGNYKKLVGLKKMANKRVDGYTKEDFTMLIRQNVNKLTKICKVPDEPMNYEKYVCESNQTNILLREIEFVELLKEIAVLNTSSATS